MVEKLKEKYRYREANIMPNYKLIPTSNIPLTDEGMNEFNEIYFWLKEQNFKKIVRTASGGISISRKNFTGQCWDVRDYKSGVELTILLKEGFWRIQFRTPIKSEGDKKLSGSTAFMIFRLKCEAEGVDLDKLRIENGKEVKKEIESPMIGYYGARDISDKVFVGAHHLDFHSSHPAGMSKYYPELKPIFQYFYEKRKTNKNAKNIMNMTWGNFQSADLHGAAWAHISRDGIKDTNDRLKEISNRLVAAGRMPLCYNTDGVWYLGDVYHGEGEGKNMGEWENDHIDCKIRFKSRGAYEYIENDVYHPVIRGTSSYEMIKPKEEWEWGDIYKGVINEYGWDEETGVYKL